MTELKNGFSLSRPVSVLFLGACPAMALTGALLPALAIGLATLGVMLLSNLLLGLLRPLVGSGFLARAVVISCFAAAAGLLMSAFLPELYSLMGVYIAVLAVSMPAYDSAEKTAGDGLLPGLADAVVTGLMFTAALVCLAAVRELLGSGSLAGVGIGFMKNYTIPLLAQAPGGFILFAMELALLQAVIPAKKAENGKEAAE